MTSILTSLTVALLATAPLDVIAEDPTGCVESNHVAEALKEGLPSAWQGPRAGLRLVVVVGVDPDHQPAMLTFTLTQQGVDAPLMVREQPIIAADCPSLPQLIAVVVGRHLSELPRDAWPQPLPPPPIDPAPGESGPQRPLQEVSPATGHLDLRLGAEVGLDSALFGGTLALDATVFGADGYALLLGAKVLTFAPFAVGEGTARLTTVLGRLGPAWELPVFDLIVGGALGLGVGATIAQGHGFERDIAAAGVTLRAWAQASLRTRWGLSFCLSAALVALRSRLRTAEMEDGVMAPAARLSASIGYVFGD